MTDIQKLSTEQKLTELVVMNGEALGIVKNTSISLKDAFNTLSGDRLDGRLRALIKSLEEEFGINTEVKNPRDSYADVRLTKIADAAEKKGINVSEVRGLLKTITPIIDIAYAYAKANKLGTQLGYEDCIRVTGMQRKYLNGNKGPK